MLKEDVGRNGQITERQRARLHLGLGPQRGEVDAQHLAVLHADDQPIKGTKIDVAFVGSCTNGRLSDLRAAAEVAKKGTVARHVRALIVPGSQQVATAAEAEGLHEIFQAAGFQWRKAGCAAFRFRGVRERLESARLLGTRARRPRV